MIMNVARPDCSMRFSHLRVAVPLKRILPSAYSYQMGVISGWPRSLVVVMIAGSFSPKNFCSSGPMVFAITLSFDLLAGQGSEPRGCQTWQHGFQDLSISHDRRRAGLGARSAVKDEVT